MTFDPGRVTLSLAIGDGVVRCVGVTCERPDVARLLRGKPAEQAVLLLPLIYSLCGKAQGIAARAALAAARGNAVEAHVDDEVQSEAAREHAWKLFVDWPRQFRLALDETFFVQLVRAPSSERSDRARLLVAHPLPAVLAGALADTEIDQLLRGRIAGRAAALADWLMGRPQLLGTVTAMSPSAGVGIATAETARGTLKHRLTLDGDEVADYAVIAPTDVHFAPGGDVANWLQRLNGMSKANAEQQALHLALAFDPCVPWYCEFS
ncbi:MAG: hypothetical protein IPG52_16005 [Rhodocyclaceae bacterium]|nr:hypothetical protein [Rhodocyclaceae bacterium]